MRSLLVLTAMLAALLGMGGKASYADEPPPKAEPVTGADAAKRRLSPELSKALQEAIRKRAEAEGKPLTEPADEPANFDESRYQLPDGGVKELLAFIKELSDSKPAPSRAENTRRLRAVREAAEKVVASATDEDKQLEGYSDAVGLVLNLRAVRFSPLSAEEQAKLATDILAYFADYPDAPSKYAIAAGANVGSLLERSGQAERAIAFNLDLGARLARNRDEKIARIGAKMQGVARRLSLVGQPLELSGTLMDGKKFNWDSYRGKVVLIDFWATWCGPCRKEIPNVKKNYELYHDKGFEVVGISLDRDREALEKFLDAEGNPWVTLYDGDWDDNDVATYYGVRAIPTVFLVDAEGKVVSTRARGDELGRLLAELLGPAEPAEKPAGDEAEEAQE